MNRIIQFLIIFLAKKWPSAKQHYALLDVVRFYRDKSLIGLLEDEEEVLYDFQHPCKILVIGCGTGRECIAFSGRDNEVVGYDPVEEMVENAEPHIQVKYTSHWDDLETLKFDVIFVTRNLPSFLNKIERIQFYDQIRELASLNPSIKIYIRPDVMELSPLTSFRFWMVSRVGRLIFRNHFKEVGDTLRSNLDYSVIHQHLVFYHYYPNELAFEREIGAMGFNGHRLSLGFWSLQLGS